MGDHTHSLPELDYKRVADADVCPSHLIAGSESVCWTDNKVGSRTAGGLNPGTYESGLVDMFLLSHVNAAVISHGSSFGYTGAALSGLRPIYVMGQHEELASAQQWFWLALTSEPCFFHIHFVFKASGGKYQSLLKSHPHWLHHVQCHPPVGRRMHHL